MPACLKSGLPASWETVLQQGMAAKAASQSWAWSIGPGPRPPCFQLVPALLALEIFLGAITTRPYAMRNSMVGPLTCAAQDNCASAENASHHIWTLHMRSAPLNLVCAARMLPSRQHNPRISIPTKYFCERKS